ncbi:MAG: endospore germination permease [Defluviitaleaceae bacterium]|nr:endospore germination permease [Defluviitaleaceae bacterium]
MFSVNDKISVRQLQALLLLEVLGTGVLILPRTASGFAGQDGWLVIIAATALAAVCAFVLASAGRLFPSESFVSGAGKILSRPVAVLIALGFLVKIIALSAMELRILGETVRITMLRDTPYAVVCAAMLFAAGCAAVKGCETRARLAQILVVLAFVPLVLIFFIGAFDVDFTNLMPVLVTPPEDIMNGGLYSLRAFRGIEFILLIFPFVANPRRVRSGAVQAVFVIGCLMLFITVITIAKFGPTDIARQMWPTLQMMDSITLPGAFIERQDALIMSFWIISVFAVTNASLFFAAVLLKSMFKSIKSSRFIIAVGVIIFGLSFVPENISQVYAVMDYILTFGIIYMFVVPVLMLVIARLRGVGERL